MRISDWSSDVCSSDLFGCFATSVALSGALVWQSMQSRVVPYVVEVDKFGEARAVAPVDATYRPADAQIAWHLARFITHVRGISTDPVLVRQNRSEEHTSELQSLMRISYAVFCLKKKKNRQPTTNINSKPII